jgi:hypothetical protein
MTPIQIASQTHVAQAIAGLQGHGWVSDMRMLEVDSDMAVEYEDDVFTRIRELHQGFV